MNPDTMISIISGIWEFLAFLLATFVEHWKVGHRMDYPRRPAGRLHTLEDWADELNQRHKGKH
jgi:hypothetical protein